MDNHPLPDDRRIGGGAVASAWALVACLAGATLLASALAPTRPMPLPLTQQAALHAGACTNDDAIEEDPDGSRRE